MTGRAAARPADGPAPAHREARTPALYRCVISHTRLRPLRHSFRQGTYLWFVDPERPPRLPRPLRGLARFEARDHFGGTAPSIRAGLDRFLSAHGVALGDGRVRMLTSARVLGHVFNPLTLYWCRPADGSPECVVAEVHNTYGERHCYLLHPDPEGCAEVPKNFYVSPFFAVDGVYRMRLPEPDDRLRLGVRLRHGDDTSFVATVTGRHRPGTAGQLLRTAVRHPWPTAATTAGIRLHGIRLWLRGLPVRPRPRNPRQKGLS
ncbi:hypothetical protein SAMN05421870_10735 [Streptomyces qinglanensis]|uniref:DUF1365 domain-containing protein n=1 Tax=Streptomyces qinglanensis TaxID=943816 RepID=A0A1H9TW66_9ACTN|nr:hypothetical protein SAMN05421870_10735 [Streptomyces qinglanensis]